MKTIEFFAGSGSFSKVAKERGHETFTVDKVVWFNPDYCIDIFSLTWEEIIDMIADKDVIWMSPDCHALTLASGNKHWTADRKPKTYGAVLAKRGIDICNRIARYCIENDKIFFIENPRAGRAVWFVDKSFDLHEVWYCRYGDTRAKPTNIWSNIKGWIAKRCHNGNPACHHERAPRGSKTGTQGLKNRMERGVMPPLLFHEIFDILESRGG